MGITKGDFQVIYIDVDVILENCTKPFVTKDQPSPSNRPSGHKTFRWDQKRLQLHNNFFMVFRRVPRWDNIGSTI